MAHNQVPPCPIRTTECLQWRAFTPGKRHPLQDLGPEIGDGRLPQGGPIPRTLQYVYMAAEFVDPASSLMRYISANQTLPTKEL